MCPSPRTPVYRFPRRRISHITASSQCVTRPVYSWSSLTVADKVPIEAINSTRRAAIANTANNDRDTVHNAFTFATVILLLLTLQTRTIRVHKSKRGVAVQRMFKHFYTPSSSSSSSSCWHL